MEEPPQIEDDFTLIERAMEPVPEPPVAQGRLSVVLDAVLPWRDVPIVPQHVDLREGATNPSAEDEGVEPAAVVVAAMVDEVSMFGRLRRLLPPLNTADIVIPLELQVKFVTGEVQTIRVPAGPLSEFATRLQVALPKLKTASTSLDRLLQHVHIKPCVQLLPDAQDVVPRPTSPSNKGSSGSSALNDQSSSPEAPGAASVVLVEQPELSLLPRIPQIISSCVRLTSLVVEQQQLTSLEEVLGLEALEELHILSCDLRDVPFTISQRLGRLKVLNLRGNFLTTLHVANGFEKLTTLCLSQNQITTVPGSVCRIISLTDLDVSQNKLTSLPSEMRNLSQLVSLNLEGNVLNPPSVALIRGVLGSIDVLSRFPRLVKLNLARNRVTELPSSLESLSSLQDLNLSENRLVRLPPEFEAITTLSRLCLSSNPFHGGFPREILSLKGITVLSFSRCALRVLPDSLQQLSVLETLDLSHNKIARVESAKVQGMLSLVSLDMSYNRLEEAEFLSVLVSLQVLNLSNNKITSLSEHVDNVEFLRVCNLAQNKLSSLPQSFVQLYNLEEVDLTGNSLETLPEPWTHATFPKLRVALLEGNYRACVTLSSGFGSITTLRHLSLLGIHVEEHSLTVNNPARFDLQLFILIVKNVRHHLLLSAFFGLALRSEYRDRLLANGGAELLLSLCELTSTKGLIEHAEWPPHNMSDPDTARYFALRTLTSLTHRMDANGPRLTIFELGAPAILMNIINKHVDVRFKLLCIRLLGNLAINPAVKNQLFSQQSGVISYLEELAQTTHSGSIKRFCNRTFAVFGICQHFHTGLISASLGKHKGVRILALDGGGTRSLATVEILCKIRDMTGKRIQDMFDLIVGTSAGGLVALSLLVGKTLEEMAEMYLNRGYLCFSPQDVVSDPPSESRNLTLNKMLNLATKGAMYRCKTYEKELQRYYGPNTMISTAENVFNPKVAIVTTLTSLKPAIPYLCRNYDYAPHRASRYVGDVTWRLWEVARATSAAPTFFDPFEKEGLQLMDGGVVANNPTAIAYHEYLRIWGRQVPVSLLLSIGTGLPATVPVPRDRGIMETLEQLVDAALSQDRIHETMLDTLPPDFPYFRLQPSGHPFNARLDEIRKTELMKLQAATKEWIAKNDETFLNIREILAEADPLPTGAIVWGDDESTTDDMKMLADVSADEEGESLDVVWK